MAVKIRMRQQGRKNRQTFRLVVTDIRNPRDGKYVETLGSYDPHQKSNNITVNTERLNYWLSKGATLSESAERLVKGVAPDVIKELQTKRNAKRVKLAAVRRKKKAAPKKAAAPAAVEAPKKKRAPAAKKAKTKDES
ncbi:MAG: 30S ribosomal protein S16 [Rhabdochlamydiaceae bacterium]|nr:30S ribosomal protein S16 [Rhabdochlamydiaceae bacterium]